MIKKSILLLLAQNNNIFFVIGGWMTIPQGLSNCPPGLEYLSMIDGLLVHQKVELLEAFVGFETNNKYTVKNSVGQKVYYAVEDNDCCTRNCCGPMRPFDMKIMDNFRNEVTRRKIFLSYFKTCSIFSSRLVSA